MRRRRRRRRGRGSDWQTWWEDGMFGLSREPRGIRARWHHGDGKRGRQIRTIAGVSRTALSVMVVVLSLSPPPSSPLPPPPRPSPPLPPPPACLVHPFTLTAGCARALTRFHHLARLDLAGSPVSLYLSLYLSQYTNPPVDPAAA